MTRITTRLRRRLRRTDPDHLDARMRRDIGLASAPHPLPNAFRLILSSLVPFRPR